MQTLLDTIVRHIAQAETTAENDPQYIELLERVIMEARSRRSAAMLRTFGAQFKPAEVAPPDLAGEVARQFAPMDKVRTKEGYLGYVTGHDERGRAVVNVVWQACEYDEKDLKPFDVIEAEED